jgi:hypothetical protein
MQQHFYFLDATFPAATPGVDYGVTPIPNTVTFTSGNLVQCVTLVIIADDEDEPTEQFQTTVSAASGQAIDIDPGQNQARIFIVDDDGKCSNGPPIFCLA